MNNNRIVIAALIFTAIVIFTIQLFLSDDILNRFLLHKTEAPSSAPAEEDDDEAVTLAERLLRDVIERVPSDRLMPVENALRRNLLRTRPWVAMGFDAQSMEEADILRDFSIPPFVFKNDDVASHNPHAPYWEDTPRDPQLYCELCLLHAGHCLRNESAETCIRRVGPRRLEPVLPIRCSNSSFFQKLVGDAPPQPKSPTTSEEWLSGGVVPDSQRMPPPHTVKAGSGSPKRLQGANYIPPSERPFPNIHHKRHYSRINCSFVYRLPMSVPEESIVESVTRDKIFDFNPVIPTRFPFQGKDGGTYSFGRHDEAVSNELNTRSYFSWTHHRGGWNAQRNVELMAAGTIPIYINIDACPYHTERYCLPGYPVDLMRKAMFMEGVAHMFLPVEWNSPLAKTPVSPSKDRRWFQKAAFFWQQTVIVNPRGPGKIDWNKFNETRYFELADEMLRYTKRHLTTKAIAAYFLKIMGVEEPKGYVFCTARYFIWDHLGLMHGLASLGIKVISPDAYMVRKMPWNAPEEAVAAPRENIFGKGYRGHGFSFGQRSYSDNLFQCTWNGKAPKPELGEKDCEALIKAGKVDLFAYSFSLDSLESEAPYYTDLVKGKFPPARVAFMDSTDQSMSFERDEKAGRELADVCNRGHVAFIRDAPDPPDDKAPWVRIWE